MGDMVVNMIEDFTVDFVQNDFVDPEADVSCNPWRKAISDKQAETNAEPDKPAETKAEPDDKPEPSPQPRPQMTATKSKPRRPIATPMASSNSSISKRHCCTCTCSNLTEGRETEFQCY